MKRTYAYHKKDEVHIVSVECCEGEAGQEGCYLKCQKMTCPLFRRSLVSSLMVLPDGHAISLKEILGVARAISKRDKLREKGEL